MIRSLIVIAVVVGVALVLGAVLEPRDMPSGGVPHFAGGVARPVLEYRRRPRQSDFAGPRGVLRNRGVYVDDVADQVRPVAVVRTPDWHVARRCGRCAHFDSDHALKGSYFSLATLAFGEACRIVATAATGLTGGPQGVSVPFAGNSWTMMQFRGAGAYIPIFVGLFAVVSISSCCSLTVGSDTCCGRFARTRTRRKSPALIH